jgi:hypothetical protein
VRKESFAIEIDGYSRTRLRVERGASFTTLHRDVTQPMPESAESLRSLEFSQTRKRGFRPELSSFSPKSNKDFRSRGMNEGGASKLHELMMRVGSVLILSIAFLLVVLAFFSESWILLGIVAFILALLHQLIALILIRIGILAVRVLVRILLILAQLIFRK